MKSNSSAVARARSNSSSFLFRRRPTRRVSIVLGKKLTNSSQWILLSCFKPSSTPTSTWVLSPSCREYTGGADSQGELGVQKNLPAHRHKNTSFPRVRRSRLGPEKQVAALHLLGQPLVLERDVTYEETELTVREKVTLLSDGVVDAANAKGELFAFDRTAAAQGKSAAEIAAAAKAWGRNDDITVVTVRRT